VSTAWIAAFATLWLMTLTTAVVVLGTLRRIAPIVELAQSVIESGGVDLAGLPVGSVVPPFVAYAAEGSLISSTELLDDGVLLLFLSVACSPCRSLARELSAADATIVDDVPLVAVLAEGTDASELGLSQSVTVVYQRDRGVSHALRNVSTPQAFLIDRNGVVVASGIPNSLLNLEALAAQMRGGDARDVTSLAGFRTHSVR
jgi:hypothetical protein